MKKVCLIISVLYRIKKTKTNLCNSGLYNAYTHNKSQQSCPKYQPTTPCRARKNPIAS